MPPIVKGLPGPVYSGIRKRYVPGVGWTSSHVYQFSNSIDANAFAAAQVASNSNIVDVDDRVPYTVEVSSPSADGTPDDDIVDIYELPPLDEQVDVVNSQPFSELTVAIQSAIKEYLKDDGDAGYATASAAISASGGSPTQINLGLNFLLLIHKGTRSFVKPTTEFRWTRIVSDAGLNVGLTGAFDSINYIFEPATLIASVAPPTVWANAITAASNAIPAAPPSYNKGWLKMQPSITRRGLNRNEITLRWVLENWSNVLYYTA